ncbi:MAG: bifunctional adenosylcobinamide kinase/adenosylcobinamide-phosphate guanylyltransferase [Gammaproteobacteria bacterium]|nr:bifunctional adenosylcobinamide kinase/adenosylcobinamide-phosphate guanylyltransferase [Marinobacter nitratireducens]TNE76331.1 MAG: bifunctional adenosylcobinamide kinase/adenosylcobinamide-phosphate guanylyltransferase [Gammaproteobacteria bacterium]
MHTLVLGGIRSGKTGLAERLARVAGVDVVYVATATAGDQEMAERIQRHKQGRPKAWGLAEEPVHLGHVITQMGRQNYPPMLLVDCMSLWLSNLLLAGDDIFRAERQSFLRALENYPGQVVIVSNEVGLGTIGMDALTRRFCDELGWLNQDLAQRCGRVVMSIAGLPMALKGHLPKQV